MSGAQGLRAVRATALLFLIGARAGPSLAGARPPSLPAERKVEVRLHDLVVRDRVAYVARSAGLTTLDVSNPREPRALGGLDLDATAYAILLHGSVALLSAGAHGLLFVDVSDPAHPAFLSRFDTPGHTRQVLLHEGFVYLADGREGLSVVDVSEPGQPLRVATVSTRNEVLALTCSANRLALAEGSAGVRLFDVSKPNGPRETAVLASEDDARDVAFVEGRLVVAGGRRGLAIYDISRPSAARLVRRIECSGAIVALQRFGSLVLASAGSTGVKVVDPTGEPREIAHVRLPRSLPAGRSSIADPLAFIAADLGGIAVLDLSDPAAPQVLAPAARAMKVKL